MTPIISRKEAIAQGLDRYVGTPCKRGHHSERNKSGACVECNRENTAARRPINPWPRSKSDAKAKAIDEAKAQGSTTYMGPPCKRGHSGKRYFSGDCVDCTLIQSENWSDDNPKKRREISWKGLKIYSAKYPGKFLKWDEFVEKVDEQGGVCWGCGKLIDLDKPRTGMPDHCHVTFIFRHVLCHKCNIDEAAASSPVGRRLAKFSAAFLEKELRNISW